MLKNSEMISDVTGDVAGDELPERVDIAQPAFEDHLLGQPCFKGALIVLDGAVAKAGHVALGLTVAGVAENPADNAGGADGAVVVDCRRDGLFHFENSIADPITRADINTRCFIEADDTVARTDGTGTRSPAGIVRDVEGDLISVEFE